MTLIHADTANKAHKICTASTARAQWWWNVRIRCAQKLQTNQNGKRAKKRHKNAQDQHIAVHVGAPLPRPENPGFKNSEPDFWR